MSPISYPYSISPFGTPNILLLTNLIFWRQWESHSQPRTCNARALLFELCPPPLFLLLYLHIFLSPILSYLIILFFFPIYPLPTTGLEPVSLKRQVLNLMSLPISPSGLFPCISFILLLSFYIRCPYFTYKLFSSFYLYPPLLNSFSSPGFIRLTYIC